MQNLSIRKASDLSHAARQAVESILGRALQDNEQVGVWASSPHPAPTGAARSAAWNDFNKQLDSMASKAIGPAAEIERIIDEVCDEVRHGGQ